MQHSRRLMSRPWGARCVSTLYAYGQGSNGALGTCKTESLPFPTKVETFENVDVAAVSAGWGHSGVVTKDGDLYLVGRTHDLRNTLRISRLSENWPMVFSMFSHFGGNMSIDALEPVHANVEGKFVDIQCSAALSAGLTESGKVFCVGNNRYGQCGNGSTKEFAWDFLPVVGLEQQVVTKVRIGFQHCVALTDSGKAFTWGKGLVGQLASEEEQLEVSEATEVAFFEMNGVKITDVAAGFNHTLFLSDAGEMWVCGKYQSEEVDKKKRNFLNSFTPRKVVFKDGEHRSVTRIVAGQQHSVAVAEDGSVWQFGMLPPDTTLAQSNDEQGSGSLLGVAKSMERMVQHPVRVGSEDFTVAASDKLVAGLNETCLVQDESTLTWGWDLVPKDFEPSYDISGRIVDVSLGWKHTMLLVDEGGEDDEASGKLNKAKGSNKPSLQEIEKATDASNSRTVVHSSDD